jgi:asparagine synthase (glutamine-hydrolysing)
MLNELFHEGVRFILHEDDLNGMFYSIENRTPFLDSRLLSFAYSIPTQHLIHEGYAKWILRESMKGVLNDQVRLDRHKKGFNAGVQSVFNFKDKQLKDYLLEPSAKVFDIVDRFKIAKLLNQDRFTDSYNKFVYNFVNTRIFLEQYG